ncbi:MAG: DUF2071 domain-containing protein [Planctomycetota bacterium]|nr:DUF2071 domain-containing protein [Planctomycetota bacterium]
MIFLSAEWRHLAMLNFEIDPAVLQPFVPHGTELEFFEGTTFVSIVGFMFLKTRVLGIPVPLHRDFEEVNLRFYVRRTVGDEVRRGVVFIKELAPRWAVVTIANVAYHENYELRRMRHSISVREESPSVSYEWRADDQWNGVMVQGFGLAQPLESGSVQEFVAENYWGYGRKRNGSTIEYRVDHPPWMFWQAETASLNCDVEQTYGKQFAEILQESPTSAFIADGSEVTVYRPRQLAKSECV